MYDAFVAFCKWLESTPWGAHLARRIGGIPPFN